MANSYENKYFEKFISMKSELDDTTLYEAVFISLLHEIHCYLLTILICLIH